MRAGKHKANVFRVLYVNWNVGVIRFDATADGDGMCI